MSVFSIEIRHRLTKFIKDLNGNTNAKALESSKNANMPTLIFM